MLSATVKPGGSASEYPGPASMPLLTAELPLGDLARLAKAPPFPVTDRIGRARTGQRAGDGPAPQPPGGRSRLCGRGVAGAVSTGRCGSADRRACRRSSPDEDQDRNDHDQRKQPERDEEPDRPIRPRSAWLVATVVVVAAVRLPRRRRGGVRRALVGAVHQPRPRTRLTSTTYAAAASPAERGCKVSSSVTRLPDRGRHVPVVEGLPAGVVRLQPAGSSRPVGARRAGAHRRRREIPRRLGMLSGDGRRDEPVEAARRSPRGRRASAAPAGPCVTTWTGPLERRPLEPALVVRKQREDEAGDRAHGDDEHDGQTRRRRRRGDCQVDVATP